jgi:hypothetical protein
MRVGRRLAGVLSLLAVGGAMLVGTSGASANTTCGGTGTFSQLGSTTSCSYATGASDTFTAPAGVTEVQITAVGGHGGAVYSGVCNNHAPCTFTLVCAPRRRYPDPRSHPACLRLCST